MRKDNPKLNVKLKSSDLKTKFTVRNPIKVLLDTRLSANISDFKFFKGVEKK